MHINKKMIRFFSVLYELFFYPTAYAFFILIVMGVIEPSWIRQVITLYILGAVILFFYKVFVHHRDSLTNETMIENLHIINKILIISVEAMTVVVVFMVYFNIPIFGVWLNIIAGLSVTFLYLASILIYLDKNTLLLV
ncbi:MAG: hypothetical protein ACNA7K_02630 [Acholeplasmataceae bacterium]